MINTVPDSPAINVERSDAHEHVCTLRERRKEEAVGELGLREDGFKTCGE